MTEVITVARLKYTGNEAGLTVGDVRAFCEMLDSCEEDESLEVIGAGAFVVEALILLADRGD